MKLIFIILLSISQTYAGFNWLYAEKIAAETRCRQRFLQNIDRNNACLLGVTAYGDARGWQGLNTTRGQSQTTCNNLCVGTAGLLFYCQEGCIFARQADQ